MGQRDGDRGMGRREGESGEMAQREGEGEMGQRDGEEGGRGRGRDGTEGGRGEMRQRDGGEGGRGREGKLDNTPQHNIRLVSLLYTLWHNRCTSFSYYTWNGSTLLP